MTTERRRTPSGPSLTNDSAAMESYKQWFRSPHPFQTGTLLGWQFPWRNLWERYQYPPLPVRLEAPLPLGGRFTATQLLDFVKNKQRGETARQILGKLPPHVPEVSTVSTDIENQIFDSAGWTRYFQSNPDALGQMAGSLNVNVDITNPDSAIPSVVQAMKSQFEGQKFQAAMTRMQTEETTKRLSEQQATSDWIKQNYLAAAQGGALVESESKRLERQRAFNEKMFEDWRGRLLEQLPGIANEVERWFVQRKPNPYRKVTEESDFDEQIQRDVFQANILRGIPNPPEAPPTPEWLPQFAPETRAGKPLSKLGTVPTPSGQQLNKMLPSQAAWLSGTLNYFGGRPWGDILSEAQVMQPQNPGGGARWRPVSQF